ncbi:MAG: hypothetical protein JWQ04_621 [Pedosphaera sp.]|nr:hypothetical protein [Pedosphaera sp.]
MKSETKGPASSGAKTFKAAAQSSPLLWAVLFLALVLSVLFWRSFDSAEVHFSNDGPLGGTVAEHNLMPRILTGVWEDLNWLGSQGLSPSPSITTAMRLVTTPYMYGRILQPASLFIVGICACFCFRRFKLAPLACILGGLVAGLNSDFLSTSCWGVASQIVGFGANYVALGLLTGPDSRRQWVRVILAGMAVGIGIMEAYDIGAIFSLFIAAFILYRALFLSEGPVSQKLGFGLVRIVLVAGFAAFIATHTLNMLVGTQLKGIVGTKQDNQTRQHRWAEATQWSLPKAEALQIIIPGIFGYRLDSPDGDNYWGTIGAAPGIAEATKVLNDPNATDAMRGQAQVLLANPGNWRFSGTGFYAGIPAVIIALWAVLQSFRKKDSPFTLPQRRAIWFWTGAAVICVPLAFGKYAPFFQLWYALPYASVIRNPTKFMHVFNWVLVILFAYGVHGMVQAYMQNPLNRAGGFWAQFKEGLTKAAPFERKFLFGCLGVLGLGLLGWLIYASKSDEVQKYMERVGIDHTIAPKDVRYSLQAVGWFILTLSVSVVLFAMIFTGQFAGARARAGGLLLGAFLAVDLGCSDTHWIHYWNVAYKYASNPVVDLFRDKPWEHRVDISPFSSQSQQMSLFRSLYDIEWHQQLFQYYNIQALKVVMEPRVTVDKDMFLMALPWGNPFNMIRTWELTNTRFLIGNGGEGFVNAINQRLDPGKNRFRIVKFPDGKPAQFNLAYKEQYDPKKMGTLTDYTAVPDPNGELGVVEFTGALPRAQLFSNWQINTNDQATLKLLANPEFDPHRVVLVSDTNLPAPLPANLNQNPGTVEINPNYRAKRIELAADVKTPSVLLLTERYNPQWQVEVDGKPAPLLRCDFIMRGIYLEPGKHNIVLRFVLPQTTLYISLVAIALGLGLCGWLAATKDEEGKEEPVSSPLAGKGKVLRKELK